MNETGHRRWIHVRQVESWRFWQYFVCPFASLSLSVFGFNAVIRPLSLDGWQLILAAGVYVAAVNGAVWGIAVMRWGMPQPRLRL